MVLSVNDSLEAAVRPQVAGDGTKRPVSLREDAHLPRVTRPRHPYSPQEMASVLERERDRTDRSGVPFAMIVFCAEDAATRRDVLDAVLKVLAKRLRISDEFGRLDRCRLGAILPVTSAAGAWTVADDVCLKLPADLPLPKCDVYVYPGHRVGDRNDARRAAACSEVEAKSNGNGSQSNGDRRAAPRVEADLRVDPALCQEVAMRPVRALGPLFIRPLPWWKRVLDLAVASVSLVVLSPLFLLIALAVKWSSPGPVFFRQMRAGLGGRPFEFYKFRSMVPDAELRKRDLLALNEQDGPAFKIRHDPRVTPLGRFLRKTSLDELPQLWNVLRGEMSLVGPRPLPCDESDACTGWHRRRLEVTPGLTCIWQVEGRSQVSFDDWVRMDIRYMRFRSLVKDAVLMVCTLPAMLLRRGV